MSSSPAVEPSSPSTTPSSPALRADSVQFHTSTPNYIGGRKHQPLNVILPSTAPATPPTYSESTITPPPRSPGTGVATPASGDGRGHPPDGTSSDKSSETAVTNVSRPTTALSRKESYKAQRQHYRREKKRVASALLHSIEDPAVVVLADWLKVRGSLKSWTKLWCVLKPGLLLLYKTPKVKSSHWVGTVLLTSCQVIERPSKKDGFCFKLYHPLEQSIWAPRGPHNETIGAVVQPLPTAHLIFRAPSQAAGHCWLDGLELALRCSNAMLRCSRSRPEQTVAAQSPTQTNISHEELEKHFNEHAKQTDQPLSPLMSTSDYKKPKTRSKWAQFVDSIEFMKNDSSDSSDDKGFLDFLKKKELFDRNTTSSVKDLSLPQTKKDLSKNRNSASTSSVKDLSLPQTKKVLSKSLASSPLRLEGKRSPMLRCFELPKLHEKRKEIASTSVIEENLVKFMSTFPKRRSSTPTTKITQKRISELRESGVKTDSENDEFPKRKKERIICDTPDNIIITETAPSVERFRKVYSSSSTDDVCEMYRKSPTYPQLSCGTPDKYSLIDYDKLPSIAFETSVNVKRDERFISQNVYVAGKIVRSELAGAASDTESEGSRGAMTPAHPPAKDIVLARLQECYVEDPDRDVGVAGELVEEVGEENKSLLWFLLKQVRPGMDLSKVVLPTFILEPRSFLDKLADSYYHADILAQTQTMDDPYHRFKCVLRWFLSGLYRKPRGLKKPYNPVLGETFRCCWKHPNDTYTYYIAEQVSHHPPVSAFYVSNRKDGYVIEGSLLAKSKFYGNSTSAILEGCARVHLLQHKETYLTTAPYAHCKGIVIGTLTMELGGKVHIMCAETGYQADIEFKLRSFLSSADQSNAISGRIKKGRDTIATIDGYWDGRIDIKDKKTGEESNLLDVMILKENRLPRYLMKVEHQQEFESQRLWSHVSHAIGNDDQIAATEQKTIIEEAQRNRAKNLTSPWIPKLFHRDNNKFVPPEGMVDQGWIYNYMNVTPWQPEEVLEYEEDFIIQSLDRTQSLTQLRAPSASGALAQIRSTSGALLRARRGSDSDTHDELAPRAKTSTRTLKQSLHAIDASLREQTLAIEVLSRNIQTMNERQQYRPPVGRAPTTTHTWDLFAGFLLAIVLQALFNWLVYHKD